MKKIIALLLAFLLALSLCACGALSLDQPELTLPVWDEESFTLPEAPKLPETLQTESPETIQESVLEKEETEPFLPADGFYTTKEDVALYIHLYGTLPANFITKEEARELGWSGGSLEPYAPGMCIGGSRFGNFEGLLPEAEGRTYTECDIDTLGSDSRGAKRIVFSNDGLIYYTDDHYESFTLLYEGTGRRKR